MNILFVTFWEYPHIGGISSYISTLKYGLESNGNNVFVLSYNDVKNQVSRNLTLITLIENYRVLFANLVKEFVKENKVDIIVAQDVISLLAAKQAQLNIPCLLTVHGYLADEYVASGVITSNSLEDKFLRAIEEIAYNIGDSIIVVGERLKTYVGKFVRKRIYSVKNFVNINVFRPIDMKKDNSYTILFSGRLTKQKGIIYLLKALRLLLEENINLKLIIAGDGEERNFVKEYVAKNKLENIVEMLGAVNYKRMPQIYNQCDVIVMPSIKVGGAEESFGLVTIEAMACGKPVIASDIGGLKEIITDGYNGFLVPEKNPEAIAEKIKMLIANPDLSKKIGINARKTVEEKFSLESAVKKYFNIYKETIERYYELKQWPLIINNSVRSIINKMNILDDEAKKFMKINTFLVDEKYEDALNEIRSIDNCFIEKYQDVFNYVLSYIYLKMGDIKQALFYINKIESLDNDKYRLLYGDILLLSNDHRRAMEQYRNIKEDKLRNTRLSLCDFIARGVLKIKDHRDLLDKCKKIFKESNYKLDITYLPIVNGVTGGMRIIYEQINRLYDRGHNVDAISYYSNPDWFDLKIKVKKISVGDNISKHIKNKDAIIYTFWNQWYEVSGLDNVLYLIQGDEFLFEEEKLKDDLKIAVTESHIYAENKFLGVSKFLNETINNKYNRNCLLIKNAVDIEKFRVKEFKNQCEKIKIIIVGNAMLKFKGFDDIFKALDIVKNKGYDFEVIWVTQTQPVKKPDYVRVYLNPPQDRIPELYREADIYICGSYYEAFPLPPLEAMASGCAVITTNNGGVSEYAKEGYNCLMYEPGDYYALANNIIRLIEDKNLREELIKNGLNTAKEFSWERTIDELEEVLIGEYLDVKPFKYAQLALNTLSLCLITKDEEKNISRCINSVKDIVDEIIVVDTGSKDRTVEIAENLGAKVIHAKWEDDYSKARNIAIENATSDWILFLDADEEIKKEDVEKIRPLLNDDTVEAYMFKIVNYGGANVSSGLTEIHYNFRLFRNNGKLRYVYPIHENLKNIEENRVPVFKNADVTILHYGYLNETRIEKNKTERYINMLLNYLMKHPEDKYQHGNLGVEYYNAGEYRKALKHLIIAVKGMDVNSFSAPRLLRYLIQTYIVLRDYETALKLINDAKAYYIDIPDFKFLEGMLYIEQKRYKKAIEMFKECLAMGEYRGLFVTMGGTGSYRARYMIAYCYEKLNKPHDAVREYIDILKTVSNYQDVFVRLFDIFVRNEKPESVKEFFNKYVDRKNPGNFAILAKLYMNVGRFDIAKEYLDEISVDIAGLNTLKGIAYMGLKDYQKAVEFFDREHEKAKSDAIYHKLLCHLIMKEYDMAKSILWEIEDSADKRLFLTIIGEMKASYDDVKDSYFKLLEKLIQFGEYDMFNELLRLYSGLFTREDFVRYGHMMRDKGFDELAVTAYIKAADLNCEDPSVYRYLSQKALEQNMTDEALIFAARAFNIDRMDVDNYALMYKIYKIMGRNEEAEGVKRSIKEIYPEIDVEKIVL